MSLCKGLDNVNIAVVKVEELLFYMSGAVRQLLASDLEACAHRLMAPARTLLANFLAVAGLSEPR